MMNKKSLIAVWGLLLMACLGAQAAPAVDFKLVSNRAEADGGTCEKLPYQYFIAFHELTGNGVQVRPEKMVLCTERELTLADAGWMAALKGHSTVRIEYQLLKKPGDQ